VADIENLHLDDDKVQLLADLRLAGTVSCAVCDYTPGTEGTIDQVDIFLNDSEELLTSIPLSSSKQNEARSLLKPFEFTATFSTVIPNVKVSQGTNTIRLDATDKVYGFTGYTELGIDVTANAPDPVTTDYRVDLDFGSATALADIAPDTPVSFEVEDRLGGGRIPTTLFRTSDSPLTFESDAARVVFFDGGELDQALSPTVKGRAFAQVTVPSVAPVPFTFDVAETDLDSGIFRRDAVTFRISLHAPLDPAELDSIEAFVRNSAGIEETVVLSETGPATLVFEDSTREFVVSIAPPVLLGSAVELIDTVVTNARLDIEQVPLTLLDLGPGSGDFENSTAQVVDSFDTPDLSTWTLSAGEAVVLAQSEGGEFEPYMLQVLGPPEFLDQVEGIQTEDGVRRVAKAFDGSYYVFMKNSPPGIYTYIQSIDETVSSGDAGDFFFGFVKGFGGGAWSMVEGVFILGKFVLKEGLRLSPIGYPVVMFFGDRYQSEAAFARSAFDIVRTLALVSQAIQTNQQELLIALLSGDMEEVAALSGPYLIGLQFSLEILEALAGEYAASPPHEQGEILGRAIFEIVALAVAFAKAGQLGKISKLRFIDELKAVPFFQGPRVSKVFTRIGGFLEGLRTTQMCFVAGTKVHTLNGLKNIEEIRSGDLVLSRDPETGEVAYKPVLDTVRTHPDTLFHVRFRLSGSGATFEPAPDVRGALGDVDFNEEELVATGEHPFYVVGSSRFAPAEELNVGDKLLLPDGGEAEVTAIALERARDGDSFTTFNIQVDDFGTYFAGQLGVWVHNASARNCFNLFARYTQLREKGRSLEQTFRVLERFRRVKFVEGSVTSPANARAVAAFEELGASLMEALRVEKVFPAGTKIWTRGIFARTGTGDAAAAGANIWDHFLRHVREERMFPDIDDVVTYIRRARAFLTKEGAGIRRGTRPAIDPSTGAAIEELVVMDVNTGEFAVRVLTGTEAGAMKTYFVRPGDVASRIQYFLRQFVK
jgi:hypothetical protein